MIPDKYNCWEQNAGAAGDVVSSIALNARYEALRELILRVRSQSDIMQLLATVCKSWRFIANVASWRLLCRMDQEFILLDCSGSDFSLTHDYKLTEIEVKLWGNRIPRYVKRDELMQDLPGVAVLLQNEPLEELVMMPLDAAGRGLQFFLIAGAGQGGFTQLDFKFVKDVGLLLASEMSDRFIAQKLVRTLEQTARQDPLTNLANRRHFKETLESYWRNAIRQKEPLSLLMMDVDHFKAFNDAFGHVAGDECLRSIAGAIQSMPRRPLDFSARIGGEEFAILLPDTCEAGAIAIAQRVIDAVDALAIPHLVGGVPSLVSVSVGTATCIPEHLDEPTRIVELADAALYRAKAKGRHQVCASENDL
mgnify:CR=1 FL=1